MKKESFGKILLGKWDTKTIVGVAIGIALFAVLMVYGSITVFTNTNLSLAMLVPIIVGGLFGPLPAALACGLGNVLADLIGGWGFWFDWSIGNALLGFIVGSLKLYGANIDEGVFDVKHMVIYAILAVLGNVLAFGFVTPIFTKLIFGGELEISIAQGWVAAVSNSTVLLVAGIPILKALAARNARGTNLTKE
ncbi:MAG TPA: ECF-type riboflavin transporter substrate-binding protein [Erysipelotrichaceae bacterium]|jgi:energy-coupling factor transport system substrate-specific component|nr:ECF-type riboflavin transporter substrate-binding protein [Erysipelotrichia bacterium]HPX31909.1 ECF-type riboflavin transporter substrate-binding protein [Erysipelotrichaceae bacterium]HQA84421.1 ECF-type riboflavin transporter substrate-binding protein [Erysipelotrichaceae bacterium]